MKRLVFTVPGEPVGKGRPKFSTRGGFVKTYTPERTRYYEKLVRDCFVVQCGEAHLGYFEPQEPVYMTVVAYFQIPKSASKVKRAEMQADVLRPTKMPDLDNVVKAVLDGVQTVAMHNDSQVVGITASKHYSDNPHVVVILSNEDVKGE